jgi:hypothetical protein
MGETLETWLSGTIATETAVFQAIPGGMTETGRASSAALPFIAN